MHKDWNTVLSVLVISLLSFTAYFGLPIFGVHNAGLLFEDCFGCTLTYGLFDTHSTSHVCYFFSWNIESKIDAYSMPIFSQFVTPISFVMAFGDLLTLWIVLILITLYKLAKKSKIDNIIDNILYWTLIAFPFFLIFLVCLNSNLNAYKNHNIQQQLSSHTKSVEK